MKKRTVAIIFILLITFSLNVFAKEKVDLNIDKNSVNLGDEITVSINFSKEEQVAYAYTAKLSYDEDVFETIDTENFKEQENWSDINYNMKNKKFALINKSGESGKKLVQIKLKVRDEAKQGKTTISIGNVTSTNGENDISIDGNSVEVQVGNRTQNTTPDEIKNNSNDKISVKTEKNTFKYFAVIPIVLCILIIAFLIYINTKKDKINKDKKTTISVIGGIALLMLIITSIIILRTEKTDTNNDEVVDYDDSNKIVDYLLEIENPDEKVNSQNADIDNAQLDTNLDGEVSTADIGRVLRSAKSNTKYTPKITVQSIRKSHNNGNYSNSSSNTQVDNTGGNSGSQNGQGQNPGGSSGNQGGQEQNPGGDVKPSETVSKLENKNNKDQGVFQVQKSEQIELIFDIEITPKTGVKEVIIGGKTYSTTYNEADGLYHVTMPVIDLLGNNKTYGKSTVELTEIVLDNGKHLKLGKNKLNLDIEILKQQPAIIGEIEYNEAGPSVTVTFDDPDNALKDNGYVYIYKINPEGNIEKVMAKIDPSKFEVDGSKKTITVNINEFRKEDGSKADIQNGDYNIFVQMSYQLDEDDIAKTIPLIAKLDNVHIVTDYKFNFNNLQIAKETNGLEKITPKTVKLQFTSTNEAVNSEGSPVTVSKMKVKIETQSGKSTEQEVTATLKEGTQDQYEIQVEHKGDTKQTISIESVELSNGKTYVKQSSENVGNAEKTQKLENQKVTIFLNAPVTQNFKLNLGDENTNITASYQLQDVDSTLKSGNLKLVLTYKTSQEAQEEIPLDTIDVPVNVQEKTIANFNKKLSEYSSKISHYEENQGNGIYTVKLYGTYARIDGKKHEIQNETGLIGIVTTTRNVPKPKKAPTVVPEIDTSTTPNKLKVTVSDPEGALVSGTVTIKKSDGTVVKTENFKESIELILNKEYLENGNYLVEINYTYKLKENEAPIAAEPITLELNNFVSDYGVKFEKINDVAVQKKIENIQEGKVILKFTATTKTTNTIQAIELDNGTPLKVTAREENLYTVEIPYEETTQKTFRITKLVLDNGYVEKLEDERMDTIFTVYLSKPEIPKKEDGTPEVEISVNEAKQIVVKVKINNDQNGTNYRAHLTYPNETDPVEETLVKGEEGFYTATFGRLVELAGDYKFEILADYDLENGEGLLQDQILGSKTYTSEIEAKILEAKIERAQPTKGETVTITYTIQDNTGKTVKYIEVNGKMYEATISSGSATDKETTYTVKVPVPIEHKELDENGAPIVEFVTKKLIYDDGTTDDDLETFTLKQTVQNAKPTYENTLEFAEENQDKPQMKFHFTDPNGKQKAFRKATVKLKDSSGKVVKTREFSETDKDYYFLLYTEQEEESKNGKHPEDAEPDTFTSIVEGETYSIEVEIEYDIEFDVPGKENETPGKVTDTIEGLQLKADYNLTLNTNQEETRSRCNYWKNNNCIYKFKFSKRRNCKCYY